MKYLVFDIGCIECGEDSAVVGLYESEEEAKKAIEVYLTGEPNEFGSNWGRKEWHGEHSVEIFVIDDPTQPVSEQGEDGN
jgi:hypothetical protein